MERRMTEEQVTKAIIRWLEATGWEILSFDYPQSGTGRVLHPAFSTSKTEGSIIPDIIAHKDSTLVFFENKSRYTYSDFEKVERLRHTDAYDQDIALLAENRHFGRTFYGIGFQYGQHLTEKSRKSWPMADFVLTVGDDFSITPQYDPHHIFG
ncbi:MAG: hypothetical protein II826_02280 [Prevotella sp.]|nr:hypothetical protein [Prevotella sp.]